MGLFLCILFFPYCDTHVQFFIRLFSSKTFIALLALCIFRVCVLSLCVFVSQSVSLSSSLSLFTGFDFDIYLFICLSVFQSICLYLSIYLSVDLSISLTRVTDSICLNSSFYFLQGFLTEAFTTMLYFFSHLDQLLGTSLGLHLSN